MAIDEVVGAALGTAVGIAAASIIAPYSPLVYGILGGTGAYVGHSIADQNGSH